MVSVCVGVCWVGKKSDEKDMRVKDLSVACVNATRIHNWNSRSPYPDACLHETEKEIMQTMRVNKKSLTFYWIRHQTQY